MGLSVSASIAILFVATVIVFGTLLSAYDGTQHTKLVAERDAADRHAVTLGTKITVADVDPGNGTVYIHNEGSQTLLVDHLDILVNGTLANSRINSTRLDDGTHTNIWMPGETLVMELNGPLTDAQIMVVTENGITAYG
jgi:archaeal flagellar protein FlaF